MSPSAPAAIAARAIGSTRSWGTNGTTGPAPDTAPTPAATPAADAPRPVGVPGVGNPQTAVPGAAGVASAVAGDLPIPGYDGLSASQVIERLDAGFRFVDDDGAHSFRGRSVRVPTLSLR